MVKPGGACQKKGSEESGNLRARGVQAQDDSRGASAQWCWSLMLYASNTVYRDLLWVGVRSFRVWNLKLEKKSWEGTFWQNVSQELGLSSTARTNSFLQS